LDQDGDGEIDYHEFAAELAARPLPAAAADQRGSSSSGGGEEDASMLELRGGPPLPADVLAKYQYSKDTKTLNTESWTLVVRDASGE